MFFSQKALRRRIKTRAKLVQNDELLDVIHDIVCIRNIVFIDCSERL